MRTIREEQLDFFHELSLKIDWRGAIYQAPCKCKREVKENESQEETGSKTDSSKRDFIEGAN